MSRQKVLVISLSELASDARVLRQIDFLATDYDVVAAAYGSSPALGDVPFVQLARSEPPSALAKADAAARPALRRLGLYGAAYGRDGRVRSWRGALERVLPVDAVVVNDLFALPLAFELAGSAPVVYDAHEHWTSESASWTRAQRLSMGRAHEWIADHFVPRTAGLMTVSPGIARDFADRTGVQAELVTNAPWFRELRPSAVGDPVKLVHVGVSDPRRRLENTIEAVRLLGGRFTLDIILARDNDYRRRVEQMVAADETIRLLPAVPQAELIATLNAYDIGVHLFPGGDPNQVYSLPNKLFDYIQARLAVGIGPSPEMAAIVREWDCGIVAESFEPQSFADALAALTPADVERLKQNADRAAAALTADNNRETVLALMRAALSRPSASAATASY